MKFSFHCETLFRFIRTPCIDRFLFVEYKKTQLCEILLIERRQNVLVKKKIINCSQDAFAKNENPAELIGHFLLIINQKKYLYFIRLCSGQATKPVPAILVTRFD